jgi:predicted GTPase
MLQTATSIWLNKLGLLYEAVHTTGDQDTTNKLVDLMQKADHDELAIAFCGHFSAGKSSLMNYLFDTNLLPTSPIPTSANVVKVKLGPDRIRLRFLDGQEQQVVGTYNESAFQALCQDGERATEVTIERQDLPLPAGVAIVDTPGIDSTDEAHWLATEANLHVSDVIFYMMDYNHVQAEGNLQFIKLLTKRNKRVYPIINQIDKHRQTELSFAAFKQSVANTFSAWGISVANIFYTTLKQPSHPHNQLTQVKSLLHNLYEQKGQLMEQNLQHETNFLLHQYCERKLGTLLPLVTCMEQQSSLMAKKEELSEQLQQLQVTKLMITNQLMQDLDQLLQNAYLMPANLRELARTYLEAIQPNFKVGLLFTRNKTEQERNARENTFCLALAETVATQLTGHIEELVFQHARKHGIYRDQLGEELHHALPIITVDLLRTTIKQGAGMNGNYILTYTKDLAEQIKVSYRLFVRTYLTHNLPLLEEKVLKSIQTLSLQLEMITQELTDLEAIFKAHDQLTQEKFQLFHIIEGEQVNKPSISLKQLLSREILAESLSLSSLATTIPSVTKQEIRQVDEASTSSFGQKKAILRKVEDVLHDLPDLHTWYKQMKAKRIQMEQQQFTVALFGAFSAGKSSFANALLGDTLLPVSPNPTTATVCRICPPNEQFAHGEGTVTFKSREALADELKLIYRLFRREVVSLEDALKQIPSLLTEELTTARQKMALPFLHAIQHGFAGIENMLDTTQVMSQHEVTSYMADEAKSAFVEDVSLYYDSILAKLGITLVDTPGADSLHARHTNVAFRYMKQADALLFVTYYNHAFSRADRGLLIQLGRVQDTFALDKMYFIVNAADLASSDEELTNVISYVQTQLNQYGIQHPRMYAVSSLESLEDKIGKRELNPHFANFEQKFLQFIQEDSHLVMMERMIKDVHLAVGWIDGILTSLHVSEEEKKAQREKWQQAKEDLLQHLAMLTSSTEERALAQETKSLLYYVDERLRLRYYDEFSVFINPSTIREAGRTGRKQLVIATMELLSFLGNDFIQELRVTTLRMEKWIQNTLDGTQKQSETELHALLAGLSFSEVTIPEKPEPNWIAPEWDERDNSFQQTISIYKNNHSFFEQDGRDQMREQLKQYIDTTIAHYLELATEQIIEHSLQIWTNAIEERKQQWEQQITKHFSELETTLQGEIEEQPLVEAKEQLEQWIAMLQ